MQREAQPAMLLADLRLSYAELDGLDGGIEIAMSEQTIHAWPLLHEAAILEQPPPESLVCGGRSVLVPPEGIAERRAPHERLTLTHNSWWAGLNYSYFSTTRTAPPPKELVECGAVRVFVLPVDGEPNERRVLMTTTEAHLSRNSVESANGGKRLLLAARAAAAAPPIGEWPTSRRLIGHLSRRGVSPGEPTGEPLAALARDAFGLHEHQARTVRWMRVREGFTAAPGGGEEGVASLPGLRLSGGAPAPPEAAVGVPLPNGGVVGHPVGAGKTRIVLAMVAQQMRSEEIGSSGVASVPTLTLCPAHLVDQWHVEASTVGVVTPALTIASFDHLLGAEHLPTACAIRLVVDEPQHMSKQHMEALRRWCAAGVVRFVWVLCGTAKEQLRRCATVAWGGELPRWRLGDESSRLNAPLDRKSVV